MGILVSAALRAALDCNVPDHLAAGPKPVSEIARAANVNEDALYRVLRALSTAGVFTESAGHVFANTPASDVMRTDHPAKVRDTLVWITSPFHLQAYTEFRHSVKTGETCVEKATGMAVFEFFRSHGETNREFNNAMTSLTAMVVPEVLASYDFSGLGTLCDVAGGHGLLLTSILAKHADLKGILFDLDHVVEGAKLRIEQMGLTSRCTTASGDFFEAVPAADSYIMKHIIHDWAEEKALLILRNCLKAMRGNGKVLLVESVIPGPNVPDMGKWIDIEMLALPGGKERTEEEYRELLAKAGLKLNRVVKNKSPMAVLEAVRA
jgi:hypothetical protein